MSGKRIGVSRVELLITLTITLLLIALLLPAIEQGRHYRNPIGATALDDLPRESQRFRHRETGISIVVPDYWHLYTKSPALKIYARSGPIGTISVRAVSPPSAQERLRYRPTRHGDLPAYERMVISRVSTIEDPAQSRYERLVETPSGWYEIEFMSENETTTLPDGPRRFLDSVRFPDKPVAKEIVFEVDLPSPPAR